MKILLIDSLIDNDYTFLLASGLSSAGAKVNLIVPENRKIKGFFSYEIKKWAPSKKSEINKFIKTINYVKYLFRVTRFIVKDNYKIIHFQFFRREWLDSVYYCFLRLIGKKVIYTAHNILPHDPKLLDAFFRRFVYKASAAIIVHSEFIKSELIKRFKTDKDKIFVINHGNFDDYLPEKPVSKIQAKAHFNLDKDAQVLLFFGRIQKYKGLDDLLYAFDIAASKNPKLYLVIAGSVAKQLMDFYNDIIDKMQNKKNVIFDSGFIKDEDIHLYFSAADIVILPYKNIYHSGVIHIALPFGKPIIASNVGDFPEIVINNKTGFLSESENPQKLNETIQYAFSDMRKLLKIEEQVKGQNHSKYSWKNIGENTVKLYESLL